MTTDAPTSLDPATAERLARLQGRRAPTTGAAPATARRHRATAATRALLTGTALAGTGLMVTAMTLDGTASADPAPAAATSAAPAAADVPPPVIIIRRVPGGGNEVVPNPVPAPTRVIPPASSSTRSSGS